MYAALARRDADALFNMAVAGGYKSKHMNKEVSEPMFPRHAQTRVVPHSQALRHAACQVIVKLMRFGNDTMGRDLLGDKNAAQFMDELKAQDPYEQAADNLVMAAFMSFRLRIVGLALNHPVVCSDWWGSIAERELEREGVPYAMWDLPFMIKFNEGRLSIAKV